MKENIFVNKEHENINIIENERPNNVLDMTLNGEKKNRKFGKIFQGEIAKYSSFRESISEKQKIH